MKVFKLLVESIRLYKEVGKDIFKKNKWNYTESELIEQLNDAKIIKNNISQLTTFSIIIGILFFNIPMTIVAFVDSNILLILMCIVAAAIPGSLVYLHLVISPSDDDLFLINKYLMVNHLLNEKGDDNVGDIRILKDNDTISKFVAHYKLDNQCDMIVLHYIINTLMLYFCSESDIEVIKPDDVINDLIEAGKITIDDYIQAIQTS